MSVDPAGINGELGETYIMYLRGELCVSERAESCVIYRGKKKSIFLMGCLELQSLAMGLQKSILAFV